MGGIIKRQEVISSKSNDFRKGIIVGVGGFGKVHEVCRLKDNNWFAMKS